MREAIRKKNLLPFGILPNGLHPPPRGVRELDDPYRSTHIEGFWKISVEYRYRYLEHPYISACISASAAGPTLEIAGILQSPLGENNTGFPLGPQGADDNRRQTGGFHLEDDISVWFDVCQDHRLPRRLALVSIVGSVCN